MRPTLFTVQNTAQSPKGNVLCEASNTLDLHRMTSLLLSNPNGSCSGFNWVIDLSHNSNDCYQPTNSNHPLSINDFGISPEFLYLSLGLQNAVSLICNCLNIKQGRQSFFENEAIRLIKNSKRFTEAKAFTLATKQLARHSSELRTLFANPPSIENEIILRLPETNYQSQHIWLIYSYLKAIVKVSKKKGATFTLYDPQQKCFAKTEDATVARIFEDSKRHDVCCGFMYVKRAGDDASLKNIANHAVHYINTDVDKSSICSQYSGYALRGTHLTRYGYQANILESLQNSKIYHQGGELLKPLS